MVELAKDRNEWLRSVDLTLQTANLTAVRLDGSPAPERGGIRLDGTRNACQHFERFTHTCDMPVSCVQNGLRLVWIVGRTNL